MCGFTALVTTAATGFHPEPFYGSSNPQAVLLSFHHLGLSNDLPFSDITL